jgi:Tfp pilus assembly protein PilF
MALLLPADPLSLNNLAEIHRREGRYAEARTLLEQALTLTPPDSVAAAVLHNLGEVHRLYGQYTTAERYLRQALTRKESLFGQDHPQVARTLNTLARVHQETRDFPAAAAGYRRALAIWDRYPQSYAEERAAALTNLGRLCHLQRRYDEAEALHRRALDAVVPPDPAVEAAILHNLANLYSAQGRFPAAEPLYRRSLDLREATLGAHHPVIATLLADYAQALRSNNRTRDARRLESRLQHLTAGQVRDNLLGHTIDARTLRALP